MVHKTRLSGIATIASIIIWVTIGAPARGQEVTRDEHGVVRASLSDAVTPTIEELGAQERWTEDAYCPTPPGLLGLGSLTDSTASLGIEARGWLEQGMTANSGNPVNRFNLPVTFNDRANEYQMNQLYAVLQRPVAEGCGWDIGGRVDLLYGSDYFYTTALGLETHQDGSNKWNGEGPRAGGSAALYGLAMPQAYAELFAPWGRGLNVKLGHFYSIVGYESVMAPHNFFYSHSYVRQYGEPFTHTGMLATYQAAERLAVSAGFTRGWDNWDDPDGRLSFLGGLTWTSLDAGTRLSLNVSTGDELLVAPPAENRTVASLVFERYLGEQWRYVLQSDFGIQQDGRINADGELKPAKWYGIVNYLYYDLNPCWSFGARFEWFRDQDNSRVLGVPIDVLTEGGNYYEVTLGLNWRPWENVTVRPEARWDWSDAGSEALAVDGPYDFFSDDSQFLAAFDVIIDF